MPFGNSSGPLSRRDITTIAQRFNAGTGQFCVAPVPKGRLNPTSAERVLLTPAVGRPFGTCGRLTAKPSVETLGYSRMSLRDKDRRPGQGNFRKALLLGPLGVHQWLGQVRTVRRQRERRTGDFGHRPGESRQQLCPRGMYQRAVAAALVIAVEASGADPSFVDLPQI